MASERQIQNFIHRLEEGSWAAGIKAAALAITCAMVLVIVLFDPFFWSMFKGISDPKGMEQAAIARELARGNGFTTPMLRPLEVGSWIGRDQPVPTLLPATYHGPVWSAVLAGPLYLFKSKWAMGPDEYVYVGDKVVAAVSILCFYASIIVAFWVVRRLFDSKVAWIGALMTLLSLPLWQSALSGLPQMWMLLLFNLIIYATLRAMKRKEEEKSPLSWLAIVGVLFGVLVLTHAIAFWLLAGYLLFAGIYFKRLFITLPLLLGIVLAFYTPWMVRNYRVAQSPLGVSTYMITQQVRGSEAAIMRNFTPPKIPQPLHFRTKIQNGLSQQINAIVRNFGSSIVAPLFFIALLHTFRRKETEATKWLLVSLWLFALLGMSALGPDSLTSLSNSNDLNFIFIPLFIAYGIAFALVLWSRLELRHTFFRKAFIGLLMIISAIPFLTFVSTSNRLPFHWPPYSPTYIALLSNWTKDNEIIASDMPWAVAWYADRKSFWIPSTLQQFIRCHDYNLLSAPMAGVYLTPITGNQPFLSGIVRGEYKEWAPIIMRSPSTERFPFSKALPMPFDNQCVFFSDYERWADSLKAQ